MHLYIIQLFQIVWPSQFCVEHASRKQSKILLNDFFLFISTFTIKEND